MNETRVKLLSRRERQECKRLYRCSHPRRTLSNFFLRVALLFRQVDFIAQRVAAAAIRIRKWELRGVIEAEKKLVGVRIAIRSLPHLIWNGECEPILPGAETGEICSIQWAKELREMAGARAYKTNLEELERRPWVTDEDDQDCV